MNRSGLGGGGSENVSVRGNNDLGGWGDAREEEYLLPLLKEEKAFCYMFVSSTYAPPPP